MLNNSRCSWLLEDNDDGNDRSIHFDPVQCKSIEMWQLDSGEFVEHVNFQAPDEVEPWVRNSNRPESATGGLRLLIANSAISSCRYICLNVEALKACIDVFHIPHEYIDKTVNIEEGIFRYCEDARRTSIRGWIWRQEFFIAAVSYSPEENLSTGLVVSSRGIGSKLDGKLLTSRAYICHPMLAPALLMRESVQDEIENIHLNLSRVDSLEQNVGLREGYRENEEFMRQAEEALRMGTDVRAILSTCRGYTSTLKVLLGSTLKAIPYVDDKIGSVDTGLAKSAHHLEIQRCGEAIGDSIENSVTLTDCLLLKIDGLADRAALQTSALHTLFAQRDSRTNLEMAKVNHQMARDSARLASAAKRDSSSMKTIAILTTIFLPGTFVSALFSTPLVESDPSQFWIYWAITIPLTGLVMGLWAVWMYWINGKNRIKDEEAADAIGPGEDKRKGTKPEKND